MSKYTEVNVMVTGQAIQLASNPLIASGGVNSVKVNFSFNSMWDGMAKTAVFYRNPKQAIKVLLVDDSAVVPSEILGEDGTFSFGVFGTNEEQVFPSGFVEATIQKGAASLHPVDPAEPTPDIYQQLTSAYEKMNTALAVEKARINEIIALRGSDGAVEYSIESGGFNGTIRSNGIFASIMLDGMPTLEANGPTIFSQLIPSRFAPLSPVELNCEYPGVTVRIGTILDNAEYVNLIFINSTDSVIEDYISVAGEYALEAISIPELSDIRVTYDGTTYHTAGDAVREQAGRRFLISYEEQDGAWRSHFKYSDLYDSYTQGTLGVVRLVNATEGYECQVTKIEFGQDEALSWLDLHTAMGVFRFDDSGFIEKIADPESSSGAAADYTAIVEGGDTLTVRQFDMDDAASALINGGTVRCKVIKNGSDLDTNTFEQYDLISAYVDDGYLVFARNNENVSVKTIYLYRNGHVNAFSMSLGNVRTVNGVKPDANGNVEIETGGAAEGAVLYTEQDLTDEQKAQARANIGAASVQDIGDISTALDHIIALQEELVGV